MAALIDFTTRFRLLIDDVNSSRFTDTQIDNFKVLASTDLINDLIPWGYQYGIRYEENTSLTVIPAGSEYVEGWTQGDNCLYPILVRHNETYDTSIIPILPKHLSIQGNNESVWFEMLHSGGALDIPTMRLGYYRKPTADVKLSVTSIIQHVGSGLPMSSPEMPFNVQSLLLYKALSIAFGTDTNKGSVWEGHYRRNLESFVLAMRSPQEYVVDVYDAYGNS